MDRNGMLKVLSDLRSCILNAHNQFGLEVGMGAVMHEMEWAIHYIDETMDILSKKPDLSENSTGGVNHQNEHTPA